MWEQDNVGTFHRRKTSREIVEENLAYKHIRELDFEILKYLNGLYKALLVMLFMNNACNKQFL